MADGDIIFSVSSVADIGLDNYYLNESGYYHIILGHRDLRNIILTGVKETIENPTHVHRSSYNLKRFQFLSYKVVSAGGHPLNVIVEAENTSGKIITASPKAKISGPMVWDKETGIYASYDRKSDVLYISHGSSDPAYADDDPTDDRIWLRFFEGDNSPAGMTIFEAYNMWSADGDKLAKRVSEFLGVHSNTVKTRVSNLLR